MVFHLEFDPIFLKKADNIMVVKLRKDAVQEAAIARNPLQQVFQTAIVGHIAAATPSASQFFA